VLLFLQGLTELLAKKRVSLGIPRNPSSYQKSVPISVVGGWARRLEGG